MVLNLFFLNHIHKMYKFWARGFRYRMVGDPQNNTILGPGLALGGHGPVRSCRKTPILKKGKQSCELYTFVLLWLEIYIITAFALEQTNLPHLAFIICTGVQFHSCGLLCSEGCQIYNFRVQVYIIYIPLIFLGMLWLIGRTPNT